MVWFSKYHPLEKSIYRQGVGTKIIKGLNIHPSFCLHTLLPNVPYIKDFK